MSPRIRSSFLPPVLLLLPALLLCSCAAGNGAIDFYQTHISPVDGDRCPMYPSCSAYAGEAFEKHGAVTGWVMTCDRLLRCGRDTYALSRKIRLRSGEPERAFDPVWANDFWWYGRDGAAQ